MSGDAREAVLAQIRAAHQAAHPEGEAEPAIVRDYRRQGRAPKEAVLERFLERLQDYGVETRRVASAALPATIAETLERQGAGRLAVPADLPDAWRPSGFTWTPDEGLSYDDLNHSDGVVTGCGVAIADTGTIVLDAGQFQGRRVLSLLPDYHLCIVRASQVVELVPEAVAVLEGAVKEGRPLTFVSGPSATSDIELIRVEGVHGPRRLEVVLVEDL